MKKALVLAKNGGKKGSLCDKLCDKIENKTRFRMIFVSTFTICLCDIKSTEKSKNEW